MPNLEILRVRFASTNNESKCYVCFKLNEVSFFPNNGGFDHLDLDVEEGFLKLIQAMFQLKIQILGKMDYNERVCLSTKFGWKSCVEITFASETPNLKIINISPEHEFTILECQSEDDLKTLSNIFYQNMFLTMMKCQVARELRNVIEILSKKHSSAQKFVSYIKNFHKCKGRAQEDIVEKIVGKGHYNEMIQNVVLVQIEKRIKEIISFIKCGLISHLFDTVVEFDIHEGN